MRLLPWTLLISSCLAKAALADWKRFQFSKLIGYTWWISIRKFCNNFFGCRQSQYQIISAAAFVVEIVFIDKRLYSNGTWTKTIMFHYIFFFAINLIRSTIWHLCDMTAVLSQSAILLPKQLFSFGWCTKSPSINELPVLGRIVIIIFIIIVIISIIITNAVDLDSIVLRVGKFMVAYRGQPSSKDRAHYTDTALHFVNVWAKCSVVSV